VICRRFFFFFLFRFGSQSGQELKQEEARKQAHMEHLKKDLLAALVSPSFHASRKVFLVGYTHSLSGF
jgi:hypothetical protein